MRAIGINGFGGPEALEVAIDRVLPLEVATEGHRIIEGRQTKGKLLLAIG